MLAAKAAGVPPSSGVALGTTAKFQATRAGAAFQPFPPPQTTAWTNPETGEIAYVGKTGKAVRNAIEGRLERYALQSVVRDLLPSSRTAKCLRYRHGNAHAVEVWRSAAYERAHYGGLQTCASVWACPVCAAKISERRRAELQAMIAAHESQGGVVLLVTRTFPHQRCDKLRDLLAQYAKAEASYKAHRDYKTIAKALGVVGTARATEATYGTANGWHPHGHELLFMLQPVNLPDLEDDLSAIWKSAAVRAGFEAPSRAHGLTVQDGSKAANYASKWGLESELTQWHRKRGKVDSLTPFDLLRWHLETKSPQAALLFREYAEEFSGRHQLQFSRGLRDRFKIEEQSDEEIAARQDDDAALLCLFDSDQWRAICNTGHRGTVLEIAGALGREAVLDLVKSLMAHQAGRPDDEPPELPPPLLC